jgi:prepilin-type N-terminal cleavage/methylation domain-containing protein
MTTHSRHRRAGFSLIEMSVVMFALGVAVAAGGAVLLTATKSARVGAGTLQRITWRADLAEGFRADVAAADAAPDRLGEWAAGPGCLILRHPGGKRHVVYQWGENRLTRTERGEDGAGPSRPVPTGGAAVEFSRPAGDRPMLTLRLTEPARRSEVVAALGGELR